MQAQGSPSTTSTFICSADECSAGHRGNLKMATENKRRSDRVIPFVSDEEVVVIQADGVQPMLAKMLDLSKSGTLVYLLNDAEIQGTIGALTKLAVYHQGKIFDVPATIARKDGRLIAFQFANPSADVVRDIQSKLIRM